MTGCSGRLDRNASVLEQCSTGRSRDLVKAFVAIGGLIVLALLGALIAPFFIDWSAYRADFEREAGRILGRAVSVHGTASARLLPFPSLTFTDVVVEGDTAEAEPLLAVDRFRMDAELAPYLSGEIRIFSMQLDRPRMRVPVAEDGAVSWAGTAARLPTDATIILENIEIDDGSLVIENRLSGRVETLSAIQAQLSAQSVSGPFAGAGSLDAEGRPVTFQLSSGAIQPEGQLPLKLTLNSAGLDAGIVLDGAASTSGSLPEFTGSLRLVSPLPEPVAVAGTDAAAGGAGDANLTAAPGSPPASVLPPFVWTSAVTATPKAVALSDVRVEAGGGDAPYALTGAGSIDLGPSPRFELQLEGEQVDVDRLAGAATGKEERAPVTLEARLEAARRVFAAIPRPSIPGTATIVLPVVLAGDTTIRDVAFAASPTDGGWSVDGFRAELPGRTRMEATGVLAIGETLGFTGNLLVASRQPSGFSDWLTGSVDPAIRRLSQAGFSADVNLTGEGQILDNLEVDIGGNTLKGRLQRSGAAGDRLLAADLQAGPVDLDAFLALSRLFTGETASLATSDRLALKIGAGPVTFQDAGAARIDADLSFDGQQLAIARFDIRDLAGADFGASGTVTDLRGEPAGRLDVKLGAPDPARLVAFLQTRLPPSPALTTLAARAPALAPLSIGGTVEALKESPNEKPTMRLTLQGKAAETDLDLSLALGNGIYAEGTSGRFGLELALSSATPVGLLRQFGIETLPVDTPQPLTVEISLSAGESGPVAANASVRAPGSEMVAEGTFDIVPDGITAADFGVSTRSQDIGPWLMATGTTLGQGPLDVVPLDVAGNLAWSGGDFALNALSGSVAGTVVSGELRKMAEGPVSGQLALSDLSMPWLATLAFGRAPLTLVDGERWPAEGFTLPMLPPIGIAVDLKADRLLLGDGQAVTGVSARLIGSNSRIALNAVAGAILGGTVEGSVALQNANGVGGMSLNARLAGIDLAALSGSAATISQQGAGAAPQAPAVTGRLDARVTLDATGQSYSAMAVSLAGAGKIDVRDGSFAGIRPGMFEPILAAADAEGFVVGPESVGGIVAALGQGARYPVPSATSEFSVAAGVARFTPVELVGVGERLTVEGALSLAQRTVAAGVRLALDAGDEAVEGAEPTIAYALNGPLNQPSLVADVQPLASFLGLRAVEREEARVEAIQEQLQERLRLRREARYYRWWQAEREDAAAIAAEAERLRLRRQQEAAARRRINEAEALAGIEAEREARERTDRERTPGPATTAEPSPASRPPRTPAPDFRSPVARDRSPPSPEFPSLPGVENPMKF